MTARAYTEVTIAIGFLAWCVGLLGIRLVWTGHWAFMFLAWNLFLATLPFAMSLAIRQRPRAPLCLLLTPAWLLFFPNAPYLLTDLVHLRQRPEAPLWYDLMLLWSAALAGLFLTYTSLCHIQSVVADRLGRHTGWLFSVAVLFLAAFGVTLGRFQRWNSWELFLDPLALARDVLHPVILPGSHPRTWAFTIGMGVLLSLGYAAIALLGGATRIGATPTTASNAMKLEPKAAEAAR